MTKLDALADRLRELTAWVCEHRGRAFKEWRPAIIYRYLAFHALNGTVFVVRKNKKLAGMAVAWSGDFHHFSNRDNLRLPYFDWTLPEKGSTLLLCEVITTQPGATKGLYAKLKSAYPQCRRLLTYRRNRMIELSLKHLAGFYGTKPERNN